MYGTALIRISCRFEENELMNDNPDEMLADILESLPVTAILGDGIKLGVKVIKKKVPA
jgi:hypothetical protein